MTKRGDREHRVGEHAGGEDRVPSPCVLIRSVSVALALIVGLIAFALGTGSAYAADFTFLTQWGSAGYGNGQFHFPNDVAVDTSGGVYVTVRDDNDPVWGDRLEKFDSAGNWIWTQTGFNDPECMEVRGGVLYVAGGNGNYVRTLDASTGAVLNPSWATGYALNYASGIAFDSAGNCYVGSYYSNRIVKYDSAGNHVTDWANSGTAGVAIDAAGNIVAIDYNNDGSIGLNKYTNTGTLLWHQGSYGAGPGQFITPWGVALDSLGNIYVADSGDNRVQKFDGNGNFISQYGTPEGASFNFPGSLDIDQANALMYVCDCNNNRIQKFQLLFGLSVSQGADAGRPTAKVFRSASATSVVDEITMSALGTVVVNSITVRGLDASSTLRSDVASVTLFRDNGDGIYGPGDTQVSSTATFPADASGTAITFNGVGSTVVGGTPASFWIVYKIGSSPGDRHEVGSQVLSTDVTAGGATVLPFSAITSANTGKTIGIDLVPPSTTAAGVPAGWSNGATVILTATDTYSGVASTRYAINGGATTTYVGPVAVSSEGTNTLQYWSADVAGNRESTQSATVRVDISPPTVPASLAASAVSTTSVEVTWGASTDALSGLSRYLVYVNGSLAVTTTSTTCTVSGLNPGQTYSFQVSAADVVGNESARTAVVNETPPAVALQLNISSTAVDFGPVSPGVPVAISGATTVSVSGVGTMTYHLTCAAPDFVDTGTGTKTMPVGSLSFGTRGWVTTSSQPFTNASLDIDTSSGANYRWHHDYTMDLSLTAPWTVEPVSYSTNVVYTVVEP
jgi:sugar lactone lactonase YvrE